MGDDAHSRYPRISPSMDSAEPSLATQGSLRALRRAQDIKSSHERKHETDGNIGSRSGQSLSPRPAANRNRKANASALLGHQLSQGTTSPRSPPIPAVRTRQQKSWKGSLRSSSPPPDKRDSQSSTASPRSSRMLSGSTPYTSTRRLSPSQSTPEDDTVPRYLPLVSREEMEKEAFTMLILENSDPGEEPNSGTFTPVDLDREPEDFDLVAAAASMEAETPIQTPMTTFFSPSLEHHRTNALSDGDAVHQELPSIATALKKSPTSASSPTPRSPLTQTRTASSRATNAIRTANVSPSAKVSPSQIPSNSAARAAARAASRAAAVTAKEHSARPQTARSATTSPRKQIPQVSSTRGTIGANRTGTTSLSPVAMRSRTSPATTRSTSQSPSKPRSPLRTGERSMPAASSRLPAEATASVRRRPILAQNTTPASKSSKRENPSSAHDASQHVRGGASSSAFAEPATSSRGDHRHHRSGALSVPISAQDADARTDHHSHVALQQKVSSRETHNSSQTQQSSGASEMPWRESSFGGSLFAPGLRLLNDHLGEADGSDCCDQTVKTHAVHMHEAADSIPVSTDCVTSEAAATAAHFTSRGTDVASCAEVMRHPGDSSELPPTRSLIPVSNSGLLVTVTAAEVDASTILLDGSRAPDLSRGVHAFFSVSTNPALSEGATMNCQTWNSEHVLLQSTKKVTSDTSNLAVLPEPAQPCTSVPLCAARFRTEGAWRDEGSRGHQLHSTAAAPKQSIPVSGNGDVNGSDESCEGAMGGALSYGTARPDMASLIQMLQDSETAPTTTDYSLVNEKAGDGSSPTVPGWVGPPKQQRTVENAAVQKRDIASLASHALADSAVAAEGDAREPWDSAQPADSGPRPMHAWKSFGNKSFRVSDSLTSSSSSGLQAAIDRNQVSSTRPHAVECRPDTIRRVVRNPVGSRSVAATREDPDAQKPASSPLGTSDAHVHAAETVPSVCSIYGVSSSEPQEGGSLSRTSGSTGSHMFFLPAPRESLLLRAGERNRELEALCSLVTEADTNAVSAVNAGGGQSMRLDTVPMHGAAMSTTPGHAHTMSGAQVSEENEEASSLMCGLLPQQPESSIGGQQLGACVHDGVDSSELNQTMPDNRLENKEAKFATDKPALSVRMDSAAQARLPSSDESSVPKRPSSASTPPRSMRLSDFPSSRSTTSFALASESTAATHMPVEQTAPPQLESRIPSIPSLSRSPGGPTQVLKQQPMSEQSYDLQPLRASIEGKFPSILDNRGARDISELQASPPVVTGCLRLPTTSQPPVAKAPSMATVIGSLQRMASTRSSLRSSVRSLPGRVTPALEPPTRAESPTRSLAGCPAGDGRDSRNQSFTARSASTSPAQRSTAVRFTSWVSQTLGAVRTLGRGRSREARNTTTSATAAGSFATRDSSKTEFSADVHNTLNMLQGISSSVNESMIVGDSVSGPSSSALAASSLPNETKSQTLRNLAQTGTGKVEVVPDVASYMLHGELKESDSDKSSASHSHTQKRNAQDAEKRPKPSNFTLSSTLLVSAPAVAVSRGLEHPDTAAPFPHALLSLPESQHPGPTPQSAVHGSDRHTPSSTSSSQGQQPGLPTPRSPMRSAFGASTREGSHTDDPDDATPLDASYQPLANQADSKKVPNMAGVRLSRESCFSGDTGVSMHGSERQSLSQASQGTSNSRVSSGSDPFTVREAMQRVLSRASHSRTGAATEATTTGQHSRHESALHTRDSRDGALLPGDMTYRVTDMFIGSELPVLSQLNLRSDRSTSITEHDQTSSPRRDQRVRNSNMAHEFMHDQDLQQLFSQATVEGPHSRYSISGPYEERTPEQDRRRFESRLCSTLQPPRTASPFSVGRVGYTAVGGAHDSMMSGATSSMWTLSSPEPSFTVSGRSVRSFDGVDAPPMHQEVPRSPDESLASDTRAHLDQPIVTYGQYDAGYESDKDPLDQEAPGFERANHRSSSSVVVQSFSGWNVHLGDVVHESTDTCGTSPGPKDRKCTVPNVFPSQAPNTPDASSNGVQSTQQAGTVSPTMVPTVDSSEVASEQHGRSQTSLEPDPGQPTPIQSVSEAPGSAPLAVLQPSVADSLLVHSAQSDDTSHMPSGLQGAINEAEPVWSQVEAAWATACDLTTQVPVLAALNSPFVPDPLPTLMPLMSPFFPHVPCLTSSGLPFICSAQGCASGTSEERGSGRGKHHSCHVDSVPSDVSSCLAADSGPPSHPIRTHSLESQPSAASARSFGAQFPSMPTPEPEAESQHAHPVKGDTAAPGSQNDAGCAMLTNDPEVDGADPRDDEEMSSSHDGVLRDLVVYASIGHDARAQLQIEASNLDLEALPAREDQQEQSAEVPHVDQQSTPSSLQHRYAASEASSSAWATHERQSIQEDTQASGLEAFATDCAQGCKVSGGTCSTRLGKASVENDAVGMVSQDASECAGVGLDHRTDGSLATPDSSSGDEQCSGRPREAASGDAPQSVPARPPQAHNGAKGRVSRPAVSLTISSLSAVGITPSVLESLALPSSDQQLQSMRSSQQLVMSNLFLGKDHTVREAAKELHQIARSSGTGSVACILRASAARSCASRSSGGDAPREMMSSESSESSSHLPPIAEHETGTTGGPGSSKVHGTMDQRSRETTLVGGGTENLSHVDGERRSPAAVDENGTAGGSDGTGTPRQWSVLAKRLAYVALAISVVVSGVVYATDGDVLALAAERMDRGTAKGELRRNAEMKAARASERQISWKR